MAINVIHILAIAPYEGLANLIKTVGEQYDNIAVDIFIGDLDKGVDLVRSHFNQKYDAILSRGETADRIRCITTLPVIDIAFSEYDILRSLKLAENYSQNFAFVGFKSIIATVKTLCDLLQYPIETYAIENETEIGPTLDHLKANGIQLVFGDTLTNEIAAEKGMYAVIITSGIESIHEAFHRILRIYDTFSSFHAKVHLLEDAMLLMPESTIILNEDNSLYFSSYKDSDQMEVVQYLADLPKDDFHASITKSFYLIGEKLFAVHTQRKKYNDQHFYIFSLNLSPVPNRSSKNGVRYYNLEEIKSNYLTSFFSMTTLASKLSSKIREINESNHPVMILGERGTGKDYLAYQLYLESKYAASPFISIDCKLITERYWTFLTKHINSPFCDNENTIYISNIQELNDSWSRQLLSLILDTNLHKRNRLMFSCSLSIKEEQGPSRDFVDYLPCTTLFIPPIKEMKADLKSACSLYLNKLNGELSKQIISFKPDALALICDYDWPDNFFQLKRVLADIAINTQGNYIEEKTVKEILDREKRQYAITTPVTTGIDCNRPLQDIIKDVVLTALHDCNGNQSKAAEQLGIGRTTLWRYLKS